MPTLREPVTLSRDVILSAAKDPDDAHGCDAARELSATDIGDLWVKGSSIHGDVKRVGIPSTSALAMRPQVPAPQDDTPNKVTAS